jgi:hypothetical protein
VSLKEHIEGMTCVQSPFSRWHLYVGTTLLFLIGSVLAFTVSFGILPKEWIIDPEPPPPAPGVQGVTLDARDRPGPMTYDALERIGVSHVAVVPYIFQQDADTPVFQANHGSGWATENDRGIRAIARQLQSRDIELVLKPQLWLRDDSKGWLQDISFENGPTWDRWKAGYQRHLMHYARMAERLDADVFCVGTETDQLAQDHPVFWKTLIADVENVYHGELTYAANFNTFAQIPFWGDLDRIGVQAYFPLAAQQGPVSISTLTNRWTPYKAALAAEAEEHNKPVLFTEIGYRSAPMAAQQPWAWPMTEEQQTVLPDAKIQSRLYRAFFESVWEEPWFSGTLLWKWHHHEEAFYDERSIDYTPQGKPAEEVILRWYADGPWPGGAVETSSGGALE